MPDSAMIGKRLGQYEITAEIGRGGMGVVYRARQISLNRDVAIKVLGIRHAVDPTQLERFKREALMVAQLAHPNIIQVLDSGETNGLNYIVMEYVEGRTAAAMVKENGAFGFKDALHVCSQVAAALGAVHAHGLIHRDVKSSNIIVRQDQVVKLADFGVAALRDQPEDMRLTITMAAVGTPHYMSPEQIRAKDRLTPASDIYSLGAVLYELLAGIHPFGDTSPGEAMVRQLNEQYPPIRRYRENVPDDIELILNRCLAKDPAERFQDGDQLHIALEKTSLRLEMAEFSTGLKEEYASRISGTGFFYVDAAGAAQGRRHRTIWMEMLAQIMDPHKVHRRKTLRFCAQSMKSRDDYKRLELQIKDIRKRQKYHKEKAREQRETIEKLISEGKDEHAEQAAGKEKHHAGQAIEYSQRADTMGDEVGAQRESYDRLKELYTTCAEELALKDAEARSRGQLIPSWHDNWNLAQKAHRLLLVFSGLMALCLIASVAWSLPFAWRHLKKPVRVQVAVAPLPTVQPVLTKSHLSPATLFKQFGTSSLTNALVAYYPFNGNANDESGNGNHGTTYYTTLTSDRFGQANSAYDFNGNNSYINIGHGYGLTSVSPTGFSISAWVYSKATIQAYDIRQVVGQRSNGKGYGLEYGYWPEYGYFISMTFYEGTNGYVHYKILPNQWYHIAGVFGNQQVRIYVNGEQIRPVLNDAQFTGYRIDTNADAMIGRKGTFYRPDYHDGILDEVRISNRALTSNEVWNLYSGNSVPSAPLR